VWFGGYNNGGRGGWLMGLEYSNRSLVKNREARKILEALYVVNLEKIAVRCGWRSVFMKCPGRVDLDSRHDAAIGDFHEWQVCRMCKDFVGLPRTKRAPESMHQWCPCFIWSERLGSDKKAGQKALENARTAIEHYYHDLERFETRPWPEEDNGI
jgi:hypothetical protein